MTELAQDDPVLVDALKVKLSYVEHTLRNVKLDRDAALTNAIYWQKEYETLQELRRAQGDRIDDLIEAVYKALEVPEERR